MLQSLLLGVSGSLRETNLLQSCSYCPTRAPKEVLRVPIRRCVQSPFVALVSFVVPTHLPRSLVSSVSCGKTIFKPAAPQLCFGRKPAGRCKRILPFSGWESRIPRIQYLIQIMERYPPANANSAGIDALRHSHDSTLSQPMKLEFRRQQSFFQKQQVLQKSWARTLTYTTSP